MSIFANRNNVISYTVNKEIGSHCYVSVDGGDVVVNAPWYFSRKQIQSIIEEKTQWILKKLDEYQQQNKVYLDKGSICILGACHQVYLYYKNVNTPTINIINRSIEVVLPNKFKKMESTQIFKILIDKLYEKVAEQEVERAMEKTRILLGYAPEDYEVKKMNSNIIAAFSYDEKKIYINSNIAKYDRNVIDYIVLHEFCHLKYKIHTKNFWKIISKYMPNYKEYENILKGMSY